MEPLLSAIGYGILGGFLRILVTLLKTFQAKQEINWNGMFVYVIVLLAVGAFSGIVLGYGTIISFLGGYAGIDLLDGYYKSFSKKKLKFA